MSQLKIRDQSNPNIWYSVSASGANGVDGVSPEVTIASVIGGHSVTITDAEHPTGQVFNVIDGTAAIASIAFPAAASWTDSGNGWWTAVPTIAGATISAESKIDLQPTAAQFMALQSDGVQDLYVVNDNAALTAYAVGDPPTSAITIQCAISGTNAPQPPVNPSLDMIYPIGSIYMSVNSVNPANVIGGTWERIEDVFLLAAGTKYALGSTGGDAEHTHEYGIQYGMYYNATVFENDSSAGALSYDQNGNISIGSKESIGNVSSAHPSATGTATGSFNHERATGNTSYTSNIPPYLAVYVWYRTA